MVQIRTIARVCEGPETGAMILYISGASGRADKFTFAAFVLLLHLTITTNCNLSVSCKLVRLI